MLFMVFISLFISCHHSFSQITRLLFSLGLFSGRFYYLRAWQRLTTFRLPSRRYVPTHSLLTKTKLSKIRAMTNLVPRAFPSKMGGAGKGPGIGWSRVQPKYS